MPLISKGTKGTTKKDKKPLLSPNSKKNVNNRTINVPFKGGKRKQRTTTRRQRKQRK